MASTKLDGQTKIKQQASKSSTEVSTHRGQSEPTQQIAAMVLMYLKEHPDLRGPRFTAIRKKCIGSIKGSDLEYVFYPKQKTSANRKRDKEFLDKLDKLYLSPMTWKKDIK